MRDWTYGCEHEWADWPLGRGVPPGYGRDLRDITIVNSNGIANDPRGRTCKIGGEINTPPTDTPLEQVGCLTELKEWLPEATVNYRSNLHLHIRVPGLRDDLARLKQVQRYIHEAMPKSFPVIQPTPRPLHEHALYLDDNDLVRDDYGPEYFPDAEEHRGACRRWRRRRVSHQTLLTPARLERQLAATSIEDFFEAEVPQSKNRPMWHLQPRLCVNLRQLRETDTIEFRHFAGTMNEQHLLAGMNWCREFLFHALNDAPIEGMLNAYRPEWFAHWPRYDHRLERGYRATCHDHTLSHVQIMENVAAIEQGTFFT